LPTDPVAPALVVLSSLFPSPGQPTAGVFVRERMFRVAEHLPLCVVAPAAWFPFQGLLRRFKPHFRPPVPSYESQSGIEVWRPRYLSFPGVLKHWDGLFMALACYPLLRRLKAAGRLDIIDAHFAYPDGYAATLLARWLRLPVTITLRGTEPRHARSPRLRPLLQKALARASRVFAVADALRQAAIGIGADAGKIEVVGNGVDTRRFAPQDRACCRALLDLPQDAPVLVSVGGLVERKGFHRVLEQMPALLERHPGLVYLIVGGASAEGNNRAELEAMMQRLGLQQHVRFLGSRRPDELPGILSAADVFVLATRAEGWANVFLEAMACGLPVVTTDVGGNREVVSQPALGKIVPFGDEQELFRALSDALAQPWDRPAIRRFAEQNAWDERVTRLCLAFRALGG
jgi:glycosyltransferase involved in cell wall biosynthesis